MRYLDFIDDCRYANCFRRSVPVSEYAEHGGVLPQFPRQKKPPRPTQIYFHDKHTTIVWDDGESTTVTCGDGETYDKYMAFCAAVCKRMFGSASHIRKMIKDMDVEEHKRQREEEKEARKNEAAVAELERRKKAHDRRVRREVERMLFEDEVKAEYEVERQKRGWG